jgi:hypothetical protein
MEIKEKDRAKSKEGFGMDTARLADMLYISDKLKLPYYYIVKEVDNQKDRNFIDWLKKHKKDLIIYYKD